jgi:hypothetical protein
MSVKISKSAMEFDNDELSDEALDRPRSTPSATAGSAGTAGSVGTICGTAGSAFCAGSAGSAVDTKEKSVA